VAQITAEGVTNQATAERLCPPVSTVRIRPCQHSFEQSV
jgi:hypothetical protein